MGFNISDALPTTGRAGDGHPLNFAHAGRTKKTNGSPKGVTIRLSF